MRTEIKIAADNERYNLYVNGHLAASYQPQAACESMADALMAGKHHEFAAYSEGAAIGAFIERFRHRD